MSRGTIAFLRYLRAYLDEDPTPRRAELRAFYKKKTGDELHYGNLYRYLSLKNEPGMDVAIVFMLFLHQAGELQSGGRGGPLFKYKRPEILK